MDENTKTLALDLETQHSFQEIGGNNDKHHLLKISVVGVFDYQGQQFLTFEENQLEALEKLLKERDTLIGFNIKAFDIKVLESYLDFDFKKLKIIDLMDQPSLYLNHRVSLDSLVTTTLSEKKSGDGLKAVELYRNGKMAELKKYCLEDVRLTRDLYEYGKKHHQVIFKSKYTLKDQAISVNW
ncbi:ribonuclease H-like domain-containing protein [Candidatus Azambacteria bacterium]|nr:ribonuclease H-like domain-containing protein [Candidatus Azambacteria bacterium]